MKDIMIFQRVEKKYRLSPGQKAQLLCLIGHRLTPDVHGRSTISSLYLDTPDFRIIRNSIDAKVYKEKLRLRAYGTPTMDDTVFLEIKKKYKGVVYKRRESMSLRQAMAYIDEGALPCDSQIMREIDYAMRFYGHPRPAMQISYEREAYFDGDNPQLRITFDTAVRGRQTDLGLERGTQGELLLADASILMEIKTNGAMPCYLAHALDECAITPTHFSKYGTAYLRSTGRVAVHPQTVCRKEH
ncbi:MAG: polyphosphate polymerase domain-containing protein [Clostridiales bacterium]|nr:polyphosphate polymerase domain-containing protein [Clostridiales bacterium]